MKISSLKSNPDNPQTFTQTDIDRIKNSISEFEKMMSLRPIVVNKNNMILGGNKRFEALKQLGYKTIPDEWVKKASDLTEEEAKRFIIADNVGFGEWDTEKLQAHWDKTELENWGLDVEWPELEKDESINEKSAEYYEQFQIIIECENEADQEIIFNECLEKGYKCKVLTL